MFDAFRCHLAGTLVGSNDRLCEMVVPGPVTKHAIGNCCGRLMNMNQKRLRLCQITLVLAVFTNFFNLNLHFYTLVFICVIS